MDTFLISIIIPVYNEADVIAESIKTINNCLEVNSIKHEFILVDDGSSDNTWDIIKSLSEEIPGIRAIRLSRNFGKEAALCAGLEQVYSDACIVMDGDLQHPPEIIPQMIRLWREEGFDIVEGVKVSRGKESLMYKLCSFLFYHAMEKVSGLNLKDASDFKLLDARVVSAWRLMKERNTFFRGMSAWTGFNRTSIPFAVAERKNGNSRWSAAKLFKLAINAVTSFSSIPLQLVTLMGIVFLIGSLVLGIHTLYMKFAGIAFSGFTTVILLLLIIGSTLMISLGIIGSYIARIFDEVKARPRYIIAEKLENNVIDKQISRSVYESFKR